MPNARGSKRAAYMRAYYLRNREVIVARTAAGYQRRKTEPGFRKKRTEQMIRWAKTAKGRACSKRRAASPARKKYMREFFRSPIGREMVYRWRHTPKGEEARWRENRQPHAKLSQWKYDRSPKGQERDHRRRMKNASA